MGEPAGTQEIRAAGAVMWRAVPGSAGFADPGIEVLLVHRPRYDDWSFPKGKAMLGEHPLRTAAREVAEETGLRPVLGRPLTRMRYLAAGLPKQVDYWAATPAPPAGHRPCHDGGAAQQTPAPGDETGFVPGDEIDKVAWLPLAAAGRRLSYERDVDLLRELASAPVSTIPVIFVRHATAVPKEGWPVDGLLRPLDEAGRAVAENLARLLACFGRARVFSSAAARCVETVLPYAVQAGVPAAAEPAFEVHAPGGAAAAGTRLAELLAGRLPTIVCGHGETLPQLHAQAAGFFGMPHAPGLSLGKGSFCVLHVALTAGAGFLVATEQHDVPPSAG